MFIKSGDNMQYNLPLLKCQTMKSYLVRCDLNVPYHNGKILDDSRIKAIIATVTDLMQHQNKVILISHFGRPKGCHDSKYSMKFLVEPLAQALNTTVHFADLDNPTQAIEQMNYSEVLLLENIRFYPQEEANDDDFALKLASLGDFYVNEAFGVSHRPHASVSAITKHLPKFAGYSLQTEFKTITNALNSPERPLCSILSGAKISTKLPILESLLPRVDYMLVGGGIACTLLQASGQDMGNSIVEHNMLDQARSLLEQYQAKIILPIDCIIANNPNDEQGRIFKLDHNSLSGNEAMLDIGPETIALFCKILNKSKTLIWNGPLGYFENPTFAKGSLAVAKAVGDLTKQQQLFSIVGGGETVAHY